VPFGEVGFEVEAADRAVLLADELMDELRHAAKAGMQGSAAGYRRRSTRWRFAYSMRSDGQSIPFSADRLTETDSPS